jgi:hypothetical protein
MGESPYFDTPQSTKHGMFAQTILLPTESRAGVSSNSRPSSPPNPTPYPNEFALVEIGDTPTHASSLSRPSTSLLETLSQQEIRFAALNQTSQK